MFLVAGSGLLQTTEPLVGAMGMVNKGVAMVV